MSYHYTPWNTTTPGNWFECRPGENGFLPVGRPLECLPERYAALESILQKMKICDDGYLADQRVAEIVDSSLPLMDVSQETDPQLLAALHRDYCFVASAYSLETTHQNLAATDNEYGVARDALPPQLAEPMLELGRKLGVYPWLDYAHGYGLNNAVKKSEDSDPTKQSSYRTIRMFHGCEAESGFINVHVAMVAQSGELLRSQQDVLKACADKQDDKLVDALQSHYRSLYGIVSTLGDMWRASSHKDYLLFRTFIMGQKGNSKCYPEEQIIFQKSDGTGEAHSYRGETGAQDSMVPSVDSLFDLEYPENSLTSYLRDLRSYRPKDHQAYIDYLVVQTKGLGLKEHILSRPRAAFYLLKNLNCLRCFRKKHWNLTKRYIIRSTRHPTATGGTPITTWLPNQLGATIEYMQKVIGSIETSKTQLHAGELEEFETLRMEIDDHIRSLMDEVSAMQKQIAAQEHDQFLKRTQ